MKITHIFIVLAILCATILLATWYYVEGMRYEIIGAAPAAYVLDKKTGEVCYIRGTEADRVNMPSR